MTAITFACIMPPCSEISFPSRDLMMHFSCVRPGELRKARAVSPKVDQAAVVEAAKV